MSIDPDVAIGATLPPQRFSWTANDVQTYHLAIGAGSRPLDHAELRYLDDAKPQVLPTFATVAATFHATEAPRVQFPGIDIDLAKVVHGSQEVITSGPIPATGEAETITRITEIWDKGSAAVIVQEAVTTAPDGTELWRTRSSIFARGEGGFGGERGPSNKIEMPTRTPDAEVAVPILPQQALMYRMCGDRNPLHSDPEFARAAGFPRPILHGLCTYAMIAKAVTDTVLDGDSTLLRSIGTRFAGVVYPGETLACRIWDEDGRFLVGVSVPDREDAPILADTIVITGNLSIR
ncbi:MaoC/PaaZ C-terminal domain-containing protein [Rhodococcus sp. I2R]|uniref:MaoC/PaaZ C-terminal domain-containing protein n=1 Tax=Rhodococcus sp. I2R TaxID=2855445 RepID=UPI001E3F6C7A|nr:MaoC/PaaZ C-terminal domain-containing protein [Rhodococcus sp. I2R]MCC8929418.1 MaoC family dehydratase N-terminal domain-containing protein [Rhodococcus sp. I2R]